VLSRFCDSYAACAKTSIQVILFPNVKCPKYNVMWLAFRCRSHREKFVWAALALQSSFEQFDLFRLTDNAV